ncbi:MAG: DNA-3-methyladenine glycosylase [Salibacteraceae bacterium]
MEKALNHLRKDQVLGRVIEKVPLVVPAVQTDIYSVLLRTVVEQQLSVKAARTIWSRVLTKFSHNPSPTHILESDPEELRSCGLSYQQINYFKNVADFARHGKLMNKELSKMDDDALIRHLSSIKGIGKWSAEMILMFSLGRPNVFPVDDLVIRNAMIKLYGLTSERKALYKDLEQIAAMWAPYRSYACYLLWDWYEGGKLLD